MFQRRNNRLKGWHALYLCIFLTGCAGLGSPADSAPYFVPHTLVPSYTPVQETPPVGQNIPPTPTAQGPAALSTAAISPETPADSREVLPTAENAATLPAVCQNLHGQVDALSVDASAIIGLDLAFQVYLPPCYTPDQRYPVIYLLHGQGSTDTQWPDLGAAEAADWLIASGAVPPFMMVFPQEKYFLQDMSDSKFDRALVEVLIPWVDTHFATCTEARCRAVGGISRGAMWAAVLALENPDLFSALGGHSLPISPFSDARVSYLLKERDPDNPLQIYLNIGDRDVYFSDGAAFHALLTRLHIAHEWVVSPGAHDSAYWESQLIDTLRWYGANWQLD